MQLELADVDLVQIVTDVVSRFKEDLVAAKCTVTTASPTAIIGRWDRSRLEQIVGNYVSNALKYGAGQPIEAHGAGGPAHVQRGGGGARADAHVAAGGVEGQRCPAQGGVGGVEGVAAHGGRPVLVAEAGGEEIRVEADDPLAELNRLAAGRPVSAFRVERASLEQVFLHLTGQKLRD